MKINFYKNRYIFFGVSAVIIIAGILVSVFAGVRLDIEFQGGSIIRYTYEGEIDNASLKQDIEDVIGTEVSSIQETYNQARDERSISINIAGREALSVEQSSAIRDLLTSDKYAENEFRHHESNLVSSSIGRQQLMRGIYALTIAFVLIILYVWFRFRSMSGPSAGFMALAALFHDVIIVFVTFVLLRIPLNEPFIAVILTVIGYSINDTIVIYDRVRENLKIENGKLTLVDLVDKSINQSLARTINTSVATIGTMVVVYVFASVYGLQSIQQFALPMIVGIASGFYSTIFIATPLWITWKTRGNRAGV